MKINVMKTAMTFWSKLQSKLVMLNDGERTNFIVREIELLLQDTINTAVTECDEANKLYI